jgi:hypothetical protein
MAERYICCSYDMCIRSEAARRWGNLSPKQCLAIILNTMRIPGHHFSRHSSCTSTDLPSRSLQPPPASHQLTITTRHRHHWQICLNLVRSSLTTCWSTLVRRYPQAHFNASGPLSQPSPRTIQPHLYFPSQNDKPSSIQSSLSSYLLLFLVAPILPLPPNPQTSFNSNPDQSRTH